MRSCHDASATATAEAGYSPLSRSATSARSARSVGRFAAPVATNRARAATAEIGRLGFSPAVARVLRAIVSALVEDGPVTWTYPQLCRRTRTPRRTVIAAVRFAEHLGVLEVERRKMNRYATDVWNLPNRYTWVGGRTEPVPRGAFRAHVNGDPRQRITGDRGSPAAEDHPAGGSAVARAAAGDAAVPGATLHSEKGRTLHPLYGQAQGDLSGVPGGPSVPTSADVPKTPSRLDIVTCFGCRRDRDRATVRGATCSVCRDATPAQRRSLRMNAPTYYSGAST